MCPGSLLLLLLLPGLGLGHWRSQIIELIPSDVDFMDARLVNHLASDKGCPPTDKDPPNGLLMDRDGFCSRKSICFCVAPSANSTVVSFDKILNLGHEREIRPSEVAVRCDLVPFKTLRFTRGLWSVSLNCHTNALITPIKEDTLNCGFFLSFFLSFSPPPPPSMDGWQGVTLRQLIHTAWHLLGNY